MSDLEKLMSAFAVMKVAELKAEAKKRSLKQSGNKNEIVERLRKYEIDKIISSTSSENAAAGSSAKRPETPDFNEDEFQEAESGNESDQHTTIRNVRHQSTKMSKQSESEESDLDDEAQAGSSRRHPVSRFTIKDVEDSLTFFTGDDKYSILDWIAEFSDMSTMLKWNDLQQVIYAKRMLKGSAKKFVSCEKGITSWEILCERLRVEFHKEVNSATIHAQLTQRKRSAGENNRQYLYAMQEIAKQGKIEDVAVIQYVIDGIPDTECNKAILYDATTIAELKRKLELYDRMKAKTTQKQATITQPEQVRKGTEKTLSTSAASRPRGKRGCYNCGSTEHMAFNCPDRQ